jgi:hypothetical protein
MRDILELHSTDEARLLHAAVFEGRGRPEPPNKDASIAEIMEELDRADATINDYKRVLMNVWEGIVVEYMRQHRKRVRNFTEDPRHTVLKTWANSTNFPGGAIGPGGGFGRQYFPQTVKRGDMEKLAAGGFDREIAGQIGAMHEREREMKRLEKNFSGSRVNSLVKFFGCVTEIRWLERDIRDHLLAEVWKARANKQGAVDRLAEARRLLPCMERERSNWLELALREQERLRTTLDLAFERAAEDVFCWQRQDTLHRLKQDAVSRLTDINSLTAELWRERKRYDRARMAYEDGSCWVQQIRGDLPTRLKEDQAREAEELAMCQQEIAATRRALAALRAEATAFRDQYGAENERRRMQVEEYIQRYGRPPGRGKRRRGKGRRR